MLSVSPARLHQRIAALARFGALPGGGVTRHCWSPAHEEARAWLLGEIKSAGLKPWVDPAGNVFGALGFTGFEPTTAAVLTGSHIDTVPEGGILDGALGVLAGLECLEAIGSSQRSARAREGKQRPGSSQLSLGQGSDAPALGSCTDGAPHAQAPAAPGGEGDPQLVAGRSCKRRRLAPAACAGIKPRSKAESQQEGELEDDETDGGRDRAFQIVQSALRGAE